jgi:hypothetical protein
MHIKLEWDEAKRQANLAKHGVDFTAALEFDWGSAKQSPDDRQDYGEGRTVALGLLDGRVHVLIFTRRGDRVRIISLRKANAREVRQWFE